MECRQQYDPNAWKTVDSRTADAVLALESLELARQTAVLASLKEQLTATRTRSVGEGTNAMIMLIQDTLQRAQNDLSRAQNNPTAGEDRQKIDWLSAAQKNLQVPQQRVPLLNLQPIIHDTGVTNIRFPLFDADVRGHSAQHFAYADSKAGCAVDRHPINAAAAKAEVKEAMRHVVEAGKKAETDYCSTAPHRHCDTGCVKERGLKRKVTAILWAADNALQEKCLEKSDAIRAAEQVTNALREKVRCLPCRIPHSSLTEGSHCPGSITDRLYPSTMVSSMPVRSQSCV
eukprot:3774900-Rhodomonas_salina.3